GLGQRAEATQAPGEVRRGLPGPEPVGRTGQRVAMRAPRLDPVPETAQRPDLLPHGGARAAEAASEVLARERRRGGAQPGDDLLARRHGTGASFRLRSAAGAEWVSMPMAT